MKCSYPPRFNGRGSLIFSQKYRDCGCEQNFRSAQDTSGMYSQLLLQGMLSVWLHSRCFFLFLSHCDLALRCITLFIRLLPKEKDRECRTNRAGQHHGAADRINHGQALRWARRSNLSGGVSLRRAAGWNLKNHSHLTVARHLREKIHTSMPVVTVRESEERGMFSAALREFLRVVRDQIEERGVAIIVSNKESTVWRKTSVKTLPREREAVEIHRC